MREDTAYNFGAFIKCAEAGVSPQELYDVGVSTHRQDLMKLATAAAHGAQLAPMEKAALLGMLSRGARGLGQSFKSLGQAPGQAKRLAGDWRQAGELASSTPGLTQHASRAREMGNVAAANRYTDLAARRTGQAQATREAVKSNAGRIAREAAPAAGLLGGGAGAAGLHAAGPADTTENNLKGMANQHLGTNFGLQSRLGSLFG